MIAHMTRRPVLFDLTSASAAAAITPITANQNSQCVAWRDGKVTNQQRPRVLRYSRRRSRSHLHSDSRFSTNTQRRKEAPRRPPPPRQRAAASVSTTASVRPSKRPLLFNAFYAQDDGDLVTDLALLEVHPEVASLDREARFAAAAHFAKHALAFATFLEVDGQRLGYAMYGEVTRNFESLPAAFGFCALEGHCRKLFRVEEIRTLQAPLAN